MVGRAVPGLTALWAGLLVVQGLMPVVTVYMSKQTIDNFVLARNDTESFYYLNQTLLAFLLTGTSLLLTEFMRYLSDLVRTAQMEHFSDFVKNLTHVKSSTVDLEFYESSGYHDLMEQARGESQSKPLALLANLGTVVQSLITLTSFAAILFTYGWAIPLLLMVGTLPGLYVSLRFDRVYHAWWRDTASDRRWLHYFDAMLSHADTAAEMRLFNLAPKFIARYRKRRDRLRSERLEQSRRQVAGKMVATSMNLITAAFAISWIALGVYFNEATLGDLAVFYQVFNSGQAIMSALLIGAGQMISNSLYLETLFSYLDLPSKVVSPEQPAVFPSRIEEGIAFKNVSFAYPGEKRPVLSNFDLDIPAGRKVAIVGVNGAGKSTLIKLLCRFYDPQDGAIEIDGTDIRRFNVRTLRQNISVLFQNPIKFHETAAGSIALGNVDDVSDQAVIRSIAEQAGAHDFIDKLPDKYDSLLGKWFVNGSELSGGEWQKIALARAYYRKAPIMILDEPTSFMDSWGEADWYNRFLSLAKDRTALIITHRFTIAMRADIIHVLDKGEIIETGTHRDLVDSDGFYARSWKAQIAVAEEKQLDEHVIVST